MHRLSLFCLLMIMLPLSHIPTGAQSPEADESSRFQSESCRPPMLAGYEVTCGWLTVPQNHAEPDGNTLQLAVMVIHTSNPNPAPDPLVYLVGGPGGSLISRAGSVFQTIFSPFARSRDIIFFDQRGTGQSRPSLYCQNITDDLGDILGANDPESEADLMVNRLLDCHDHLLGSGIDLRFYNSASSAQDLQLLRQELGYDSWNLLGISYGTRLALTALRDDPSGIRSVILDSVYPPQEFLYADVLDNAERALNVLFEDCQADERCRQTYPDLESVFWDLVADLNAHPEAIPISGTPAGDFELILHGDRLFDWTFGWLYAINDIEAIPHRLYTLRDNPRDPMTIRAGLQQDLTMVFISLGMYYTVQCSEEVSHASPDALSGLIARHPALSTHIQRNLTLSASLFDVCGAWSMLPPDPRENQPVMSDVPALLLSGRYDPITPPRWAESVAETLSNSYTYTLPGVGHGVVRSTPCGQAIIQSFLDDPSQSPDTACLADETPPDFRIRPR